jgi:predicted DCC family thiol-disulfide oxidoreductase YuxK
MAGSAARSQRLPTAALLFDGDCGICTWLVEAGRRIDRRGRFVFGPYQDLDAPLLACYGLTATECGKRLYVVEPWPAPRAPAQASSTSARPRTFDRGPQARGGVVGLNLFLWRSFPWSLAVVVLYAIPVLLLAELLVYRWVARNRAGISRRLHLRACRPASNSDTRK